MNLSPDTTLTLGLLGFAVIMLGGGFAGALWFTRFSESFKREVREEIRGEMKSLRSDTLGATNEHRRTMDKTVDSIRDSINALEKEQYALRLHAAENFVTKADFHQSLQAVIMEIRGSSAQIKSLEATVVSSLKG